MSSPKAPISKEAYKLFEEIGIVFCFYMDLGFSENPISKGDKKKLRKLGFECVTIKKFSPYLIRRKQESKKDEQ